MRFRSAIALYAEGEAIRRDAGLWDRLKSAFGAKPNLATDRVHTLLTTAHLVRGAKDALERLGVNNASVLVIDGHVLFEDRIGRADDFGDLLASFHDHESVHGRAFKDLRLMVEHTIGGLRLVIEIAGRGEHGRDEATAMVVIGARVLAYEPLEKEAPEAFRERAGPLLETPDFTESHRLRFIDFAARVRAGLRASLPDVRITASEPRALVERPARGGAASLPERAANPARHDPHDPRYDPYERLYPAALREVAVPLFWSSLSSWSWHPHYVVVDAAGTECPAGEQLRDPTGERNDEVGATIECAFDAGSHGQLWSDDGDAWHSDADW